MLLKKRKSGIDLIVIAPLVLLGAYSLMFPKKGTSGAFIVPSFFFELLVFSYSTGIFVLFKKSIVERKLCIAGVNFVYVVLSYVYAVHYRNVHVMDFFMAFKTFVYFIFLPLMINVKIFEKNGMLKFIDVIFIVFFVKYSLSHALNVRDRPVVYCENNFELMLLCVLYLVRFQLTKKNCLAYLFWLGGIVVLSFSRSALLMYATIFLFVINEKVGNGYKWIVLPGALLFVCSLILYVFLKRSGSFEGIDRYTFFIYFLGETEDWNFLQYMTGAPRITPLSAKACGFFSYWQNLISRSGDGSCYSVVFHSYLLRVVFDHGFIGLSAVTFFTYKILRWSDIDRQIIWLTIAIFMLNGLAVSSFNSVFFPISMIFLMGTKYKHEITKSLR